jgi:hypothetical protein
MKTIACVLLFLVVWVVPAAGQIALPADPKRADDGSVSIVVRGHAEDAISSHFLQPHEYGRLAPAARALPDRPDSELPPAARYALGTTFAAISVTSMVGGVAMGIYTVDLLRQDPPSIGRTFSLLTGMMSAGAIGFSIASGVWSVRLFRGKVMLL